jgi:putative hydrolase of the HAD superfamily
MTILALDLDGVVVLGHPDGGRWDKDIERDLGIDPRRLRHFFQTHWSEIVVGEADLFETLERIWPELASDGNIRSFVAYWFAMDSRLDADVLAQVDAWRGEGRPAYLATVQEHHRARHVWEELGLRSHFDGMLYSAELGARKSERAFFEKARARLPARSADEILFLDDTPANVETARSAGWRAFLHREPDDLRRAIDAVFLEMRAPGRP